MAEEVLTLLRVVLSCGTQQSETRRYINEIEKAKKNGVSFGWFLGLGMALPDTAVFALFGVAMIYGGQLVRDGEIDSGEILTILFAGMLVRGAFSFFAMTTVPVPVNPLPTFVAFSPSQAGIGFGQGMALFPRFIAGKLAGGDIFAVIDRETSIDPMADKGAKPELRGAISFKDVHFAYPTKPEAAVLTGLSFELKPGQSLALVGSSGCGKSTTIRFGGPSYGREFSAIAF